MNIHVLTLYLATGLNLFYGCVDKPTEGARVMNTKRNLALAVLAGISIGAMSVVAIHAQEAKTPPAYLIAETEVTDRAAFQKYAERVPETLAPFSGSFHFVVRGGKTQALEGQPPKGIVVIAFDSTEKALAWYNSPAYQAIKPIRQGASTSRMFIAEGLLPQ
jgi:uncharacterized protein (DUF1330 family)